MKGADTDRLRAYALKRLLQFFAAAFGVSIALFTLYKNAPGNPCVGANWGLARAGAVRLCSREWALNGSVLSQYWAVLTHYLSGTTGPSYSGSPVNSLVLQALPISALLVVSAFVFEQLLSILLGTLGAIWSRSVVDKLLAVLSYVAVSTPQFWLGLVLLFVFAEHWRIFPVGRVVAIQRAPFWTRAWRNEWLHAPLATTGDLVYHLILPGLVLSFVLIAADSRFIRAALLSASGPQAGPGEPGASGRRATMLGRSFREVAPLVVANSATSVSALIGASLVVEIMFTYTGIGYTFFNSLLMTDSFLVLEILALAASVMLVVNLLADLVSAALDERLDAKGGLPTHDVQPLNATASFPLSPDSVQALVMPATSAETVTEVGQPSGPNISGGGTRARTNAVWPFLQRYWTTLTGAAGLVLFGVIALIGPLITPEPAVPSLHMILNPRVDYPPQLSYRYVFGTDQYGASVMMQVILGFRGTLELAVPAAVLAVLIGGGVGALCGYFGGVADWTGLRLTEVATAFPFLPLFLLVEKWYGYRGTGALIPIIGFIAWAGALRAVRSDVRSFRSGATQLGGLLYAKVARTLAVASSLATASIIVAAAFADWLGLGARPPSVTWGIALSSAQLSGVTGNWWSLAFPGLALGVTLLSLIMIGAGLRDASASGVNDR